MTRFINLSQMIAIMGIAFGCSSPKFNTVSANKKAKPLHQQGDALPAEPEETAENTKEEDSGSTDSSEEIDVADLCDDSTGGLNLVAMFDNSGSQTAKDMEEMQLAAQNFVADATALLGEQPHLKISMGVVRFATNAFIGTNRWNDIQGEGANEKIHADIIEATSVDAGKSHFDSAFEKAKILFEEKKARTTNKNQRNYILFLTDGRPTKGTLDPAFMLAENLVEKNGVAILTVQTGGLATAEEEIKTLALPLEGLVSEKHIGQWYDARGQGSIEPAFSSLLGEVPEGCKPGSETETETDSEPVTETEAEPETEDEE